MASSKSALENTQLTHTLYDQKMYVSPHDLIGKSILKNKIFDRFGIEFMVYALLQIERPIVLDIGANIGVYTLVMGKFAHSIIAVEPQKDTFSILLTNIRANQLDNVVALNLGFSSRDTNLPFYINLEGNNGASTFMPEHKARMHKETKLTVKIGDNIIQQLGLEKVDYMKLDVEGHEVHALVGLSSTICRYRPIITLEWNSNHVRRGFEKLKLLDTLFKGYHVFSICSNVDKSLWRHKSFWRLKRYYVKHFCKKRWSLTKFIWSKNYSNITFIPYEKTTLFDTHILNAKKLFG